jgi:hypothetical protein
MLFHVLLRRLRPFPHALGAMSWDVAAADLGMSTGVLLTAMLLRGG